MNRPRTRILVIGAATVAALLVGGISLAAANAPAPDGSMAAGAPVEPARGSAGALQDPLARPAVESRAGQTAARVEIPAIAVDSSLEQLPLDPATGVLVPPTEWLSAGWYRDGTVPGDVGPAVVAGHVDSTSGPAVFARLGELVPGDEIRITLSTGEVTVFVVDSQTDAPKNAFPTSLVYGPTPTAQLRLITCDGDFDSSTGHYVDNLIVFASLKA